MYRTIKAGLEIETLDLKNNLGWLEFRGFIKKVNFLQVIKLLNYLMTQNLTIDQSTNAENHRDRAVGVILSEMGSDGTLGVTAIKSQEGLVIAQSEESAIYQQMPGNAIASGVTDAILPPEAMPETICRYFQQRSLQKTQDNSQEWINQIFNLLRSETGNDFSLS